MTKTFNCASCSAPLEFEGRTMQKCGFCGSTVIVPSQLFHGGDAVPADVSSMTGKALKLAEIQRLIHSRRKIEAIKVFRKSFGVDLKEAKRAVEALERGESIDISGMQARVSGVQLDSANKAVRKASLAVGGTMLASIAIVAMLTIGGMAAAFYFVSQSVEPASNTDSDSLSTPVKVKADSGSADTVELLRFGGEGTGAGKFKDNRHVAVDGNGNIYSSDYEGGRIQVFDGTGKFITQWNVPEGPFLYDLAADRRGVLYVANSKGIFAFDGASGKLLHRAPQSTDPRAIALTLDGRVVASTGKGISILDASLKLIREFKDAAEQADSSFGFRSIAVDGNGVIYAADRTGGDICKFSSAGKFLNRFSTGTRRSPNSIALDAKGRIFVSDTSNIRVFDESGREIKTLPARQAFGIAFNDSGEMFVASRPDVLKYKLNF